MVLGAVVFKLLVWRGAEGYVSGLQDAAAKGNYVQNVFGKPKDRDRLECPGVDEKIILKWMAR